VCLRDIAVAAPVAFWVLLRLNGLSSAVSVAVAVFFVFGLAYVGRYVLGWIVMFAIAYGAHKVTPKGDP